MSSRCFLALLSENLIIICILSSFSQHYVTQDYLLAPPNGACEPKEGAPLAPPPNPSKPPPAGDDDAKEPNPPTFAVVANPPEASKAPDDPPPPKDEPPPPLNPVLFVIPSCPNAGAVVDGVAVGCGAPTPNIVGSRLYFLARLRNSCSSFPAYLVNILSTPPSLDGSLVW